jgi:phospholipase A-2-activating protein
VFNIELDDKPGRPSLKLPYNSGNDPYMVAQQFIHKHKIRQDSLDEIAQFITKNTHQNVACSYYKPIIMNLKNLILN